MIAEANKKVEVKNSRISSLDNKVTELEEEFSNLTDKDAKISNLTKQVEVWKEKFSLARGVIMNQDEIIFLLTKKYDAQLKITNSYKDTYETLQVNTKNLQKIVTAQDWQIKKLTVTSRLKTGIVLAVTGVVLYSLLKD